MTPYHFWFLVGIMLAAFLVIAPETVAILHAVAHVRDALNGTR